MSDEQSILSLDENRLIAERRSKLSVLRDKGNAFPNNFRRQKVFNRKKKMSVDRDCAVIQEQFKGISKEDLLKVVEGKSDSSLKKTRYWCVVAGRIMAKRGPFFVVRDSDSEIQLYLNVKDERVSVQRKVEKLKSETKSWDIGDIVFAEGFVQRSGKGDLYIELRSAGVLTKSLRPLPEKFHGLQDVEARYRQRYVDLIMSEETRKTFRIRSKLIDAIRDFLTDRDYLEVETPMMQSIPGGASAKPFVTFHNALDLEMFLRISPELYLKRLVVGGFERVFEINRNFRNEGLSPRHNPEFTMIEFYQAYADYHDLMNLTEEMLRFCAQRVLGKTLIDYGDKQFDFGKPFARMSVFDSILHFNPTIKADELRTMAGATAIAQGLKIAVKPTWGLGKVHIEIFEATVEEKLEQPTFITHYPTEVSPLARRNDDDPSVTDRFEFFIGGREIANGFSELNDAEDQAERFAAQVKEKEAGDDEAMFFDADYVTALEYGLPPTAGEGIGIDRLVMLFTNSPSIRDVLLFPHMRPQG